MIQPTQYRGDVDYLRVRDLLVESYAITGRLHNWGVDCWDWFRFNGHVHEELANARTWEKDIGLWETAGGNLVGVAIVEGGGLDLQIHPEHRQIEGDMLRWAERHHLATKPDGIDTWPLSTYVYDYDLQRQGLLEERGFENVGQDSYWRRRSLDSPLPSILLPPGYSARCIDPADREDLEKRAAVANSAFGSARHTADTIAVLQRAPTYLPELDLVAVGPGGIFAASRA